MKKFIRTLVNQITRTNDLVEKQDRRILLLQSILQKQEESLRLIVQRLERIEELQIQIAEILDRDLLSLLDQPLLFKQDVIDKLQVADSTYRSYVEEGQLKPMKLGKVEYFFARDFIKSLLKTRYRKRK